jgi:hypothetical protein
VTKIDGIAPNSQKRKKGETHFVLDIAGLYPKESSGNRSLDSWSWNVSGFEQGGGDD